MLEKKTIIDAPEAIIENNKNRRVNVDVHRFVELEALRKSFSQAAQECQRQANVAAKSLSQGAASEDERAAARQLRDQIKDLEQKAGEAEKEAEQIWKQIPNLTHPAAPIGDDDSFNMEIGSGATPKKEFSFKPKDHVELATNLGIVDFEAGSKVAGPGFNFLRGDGVMLELAMQNYVINKLTKDGFIPMITPDMAKQEVMMGTGYVPRGSESNTYKIEDQDLCLIATSEITLCGQYADTVFKEEDLPLFLCGISHCFRTERASGQATRGLYRVHQFSKVEMVAICKPEDSEKVHQRLLETEMSIFDDLEIPYRIVENATGDLGASAYRKFDIEAWMPGRGVDGEYGEVTSTSNCTDYQARRLNIRYAPAEGGKRQYVHTLNGTALALGRAMIAVLENQQQPDGTITIPSVLRPFIGKDLLTSNKFGNSIAARPEKKAKGSRPGVPNEP